MGQFNNGYRRPDFSGSKDFYSPSNSSLVPVPASQPKSKKKILITSLIIAVLFVVVFAVLATTEQGNPNNKELSDFYDTLDDLYLKYASFNKEYIDKIGYDPEQNEDSLSNLLESVVIVAPSFYATQESLEKVKEAYASKEDKMSKQQKENYEKIILTTDDMFNTVNSNINSLLGFITITFNVVSARGIDKEMCGLGDSIQEIQNLGNDKISEVSKAYAAELCDTYRNSANTQEYDIEIWSSRVKEGLYKIEIDENSKIEKLIDDILEEKYAE